MEICYLGTCVNLVEEAPDACLLFTFGSNGRIKLDGELGVGSARIPFPATYIDLEGNPSSASFLSGYQSMDLYAAGTDPATSGCFIGRTQGSSGLILGHSVPISTILGLASQDFSNPAVIEEIAWEDLLSGLEDGLTTCPDVASQIAGLFLSYNLEATTDSTCSGPAPSLPPTPTPYVGTPLPLPTTSATPPPVDSTPSPLPAAPSAEFPPSVRVKGPYKLTQVCLATGCITPAEYFDDSTFCRSYSFSSPSRMTVTTLTRVAGVNSVHTSYQDARSLEGAIASWQPIQVANPQTEAGTSCLLVEDAGEEVYLGQPVTGLVTSECPTETEVELDAILRFVLTPSQTTCNAVAPSNGPNPSGSPPAPSPSSGGAAQGGSGSPTGLGPSSSKNLGPILGGVGAVLAVGVVAALIVARKRSKGSSGATRTLTNPALSRDRAQPPSRRSRVNSAARSLELGAPGAGNGPQFVGVSSGGGPGDTAMDWGVGASSRAKVAFTPTPAGGPGSRV